MLSTSELVTTYTKKKALWEVMQTSTIKIQVETVDVRRAFGRIDVLIRPLEGQGTGQAWVDSKYLDLQDQAG